MATEPGPMANPVARCFVATRPPFLLASLTPGLIGLATAYRDHGSIYPLLAGITLLGPVLAQAAGNVLNDYYDAQNGTDALNTDRVFPFTGGSRMIQNGAMSEGETARLGWGLLLAAVLCGTCLLPWSGWGLLGFIAAGAAIAWAYSAPPLRLNSRGLGEVCIALAFGLLIPLGADYVQRNSLALLPLVAGFPFAMMVTNLLYINQFPDYRADAAVGKNHWVVRLGPDKAKWVYLALSLAAWFWLGAAVAWRLLPVACLLTLLAAVPSLAAAIQLLRHARQPSRLRPAIQWTILACVTSAPLMALGLVLG